MKKCLLFTFDYELFLGERSGSVSDCMIEPTDKLIAVFDKYKVKAIFFVDTTYLGRLKEQGLTVEKCRKDYEIITKQVQELVRRGHYIYPHIHPHWLDAMYLAESNQWSLHDISRYRFHNISENERAKIFLNSLSILNEIIRPVDPSYEINGFRAGGWSIQPFSDFRPYFEQYGIKYDFSVLPGRYQLSNAQYFDFSSCPDKPIYRFQDDITIESENGRFLELVSSIVRVSPSLQFINRLYLQWLYRIKGDHTYGKGEGQRSKEIPASKPVSAKGTAIHNQLFQPASLETFNSVKFFSYLRYFQSHSYVQFVSHPKMLSNHNINTVSRFLKLVTRRYDIEFDFKEYIKLNKNF